MSALSKKGLEKKRKKNIQQYGCPFHAPHPQLDSIEKKFNIPSQDFNS